MILQCAVLQNRIRVISEASIARLLGRRSGGRARKPILNTGDQPMPVLLSAPNLEPFVQSSLRVALSEPVLFWGRGGQRRGVDATLLPEICQVWLNARDSGSLRPHQYRIAERADTLMHASAGVGFAALIDEATGYQEVRDRDALQRILDSYIPKKFLPWTKRFPDEFFDQLFRLRRWQHSPVSIKRPMNFGRIVSELIYEKLPDDVIEELLHSSPIASSDEVGHALLDKHIAGVTALMRASNSWRSFKRLFDRAFPPPVGREELSGKLDQVDEAGSKS